MNAESGKVCKIVAVKRCCPSKVRLCQPPVVVSNGNRNINNTNRDISSTNRDTRSNEKGRDAFNIPTNDTDLERMFSELPEKGVNILEFGKSDKELSRDLLGPSVDDATFCERIAQCSRHTDRSLDPPPPPFNEGDLILPHLLLTTGVFYLHRLLILLLQSKILFLMHRQ